MTDQGTPAFGIAVAQAGKDLGTADPVIHQSLADLVILTSNRSAERAAKEAVAEVIKANGKTSPANKARFWLQWSVTIAIAILAAWWGTAQMFAERPTQAKVEKLIGDSWGHHAQHPDSKIQIELTNKAVQDQRVQLGRIEEGIANIKDRIEEIGKRP